MQKNWGFFLILKKALVKMCSYLGGGGKLEGGEVGSFLSVRVPNRGEGRMNISDLTSIFKSMLLIKHFSKLGILV